MGTGLMRTNAGFVAASLTFALGTLWAPVRADAFSTFLDDPNGFSQAAGESLVTFDFEDVEVNPAGFGAFSNGATFGIATLESLSLEADIDLFAGGGDTGLDGTFLVGPRLGGLDVRPGGAGAIGTPEDDDDFRIRFDPPARAVSLAIVGNRAEDGESMQVFSGATLLASEALPGGGDEAVRFWGIVVEPGEDPITSLEVLEGLEVGVGSDANDDIAFDNLSYVQAPACDDRIDNDGDGFVDFPEDLGCDDSNDDNEDSCVPVIDKIAGARDVTLRNTSTGGSGSTTVKRITVSASLPSSDSTGDCPDGSVRPVAIALSAAGDSGSPFFTDLATNDSRGTPLVLTAGANKGERVTFRVPVTTDECGTTPDPDRPEILIGALTYVGTVSTETSSSTATKTVGIACKP